MNRTRSAGFVITLEFLLVMALVVVPIAIGLILVGRKLYTLYLSQREFIEQPYSRAVVWDSTDPGPTPPPRIVGPVVGYDRFEAPLVIFRDDATKAGAVLGVRPYRFTSYSKVYYSDIDCTGMVYLRTAASLNGEVGFLYQLQGINYAMGMGNVLYKEGAGVSGLTFQSVWSSQNTDDLSPASSPSSACKNQTVDSGTTFTLGGLAALTRVGTLATGTYGNCVPCVSAPFPPPLSGVPNGTMIPNAIISYSGGNPNVAPYVGTFTITKTSDRTFTYTLPVDPGLNFPSGQLQFVTVSGSLGTGAVFAFALATTVIDLDSAPPNFTAPFRLAFPTPSAGPGLPAPYDTREGP